MMTNPQAAQQSQQPNSPLVHTAFSSRQAPIDIKGFNQPEKCSEVRTAVEKLDSFALENQEVLSLKDPNAKLAKMPILKDSGWFIGAAIGAVLRPSTYLPKTNGRADPLATLKFGAIQPNQLNPLRAVDGELAEIVACMIESGNRPIVARESSTTFKLQKGPECFPSTPDLKDYLERYTRSQADKFFRDPNISKLLTPEAITDLNEILKQDPLILRARSKENLTVLDYLVQVSRDFAHTPQAGQQVLSFAIRSIKNLHSQLPSNGKSCDTQQVLIHFAQREPGEFLRLFNDSLRTGQFVTRSNNQLLGADNRPALDHNNPKTIPSYLSELLTNQVGQLLAPPIKVGSKPDWKSNNIHDPDGTTRQIGALSSNNIATAIANLSGENVSIVPTWNQAVPFLQDAIIGDLAVIKSDPSSKVLRAVEIVAFDPAKLTVKDTYGKSWINRPSTMLAVSGRPNEYTIPITEFESIFEALIVTSSELSQGNRAAAQTSKRLRV
mgnify:CR=1 FL=1